MLPPQPPPLLRQSAHAALWIAKNSSGALETVVRPTEGNDINGIVLKKKVLAEPFMKAMQGLMDSGCSRAPPRSLGGHRRRPEWRHRVR